MAQERRDEQRSGSILQQQWRRKEKSGIRRDGYLHTCLRLDVLQQKERINWTQSDFVAWESIARIREGVTWGREEITPSRETRDS